MEFLADRNRNYYAEENDEATIRDTKDYGGDRKDVHDKAGELESILCGPGNSCFLRPNSSFLCILCAGA